MPSSGRGDPPDWSRRSQSAAAARAASPSSVQIAFSPVFTSSIRARYAATTSVARARRRSARSDPRSSSRFHGWRGPPAPIHRDGAARESPFASDLDDQVLVETHVGELRQRARQAVESVQIAAPADGVVVDLFEHDAPVPVAPVPSTPTRLVLFLER